MICNLLTDVDLREVKVPQSPKPSREARAELARYMFALSDAVILLLKINYGTSRTIFGI